MNAIIRHQTPGKDSHTMTPWIQALGIMNLVLGAVCLTLMAI